MSRSLPTVILALAMVLFAQPVAAQTPIQTSPAAGGVVGGTVDRVELVFAQSLTLDGSFVVVTDDRGAAVPADGPAALDEGRKLSVPIRALTRPGVYRVDYRAIGAGGGEVVGSFEFTYDPAAASPTSLEAPSLAPEAGDGFPWVPVLGGLVVAALLIVRFGRRNWWFRW